jgi:hypothetical protein
MAAERRWRSSARLRLATEQRACGWRPSARLLPAAGGPARLRLAAGGRIHCSRPDPLQEAARGRIHCMRLRSRQWLAAQLAHAAGSAAGGPARTRLMA